MPLPPTRIGARAALAVLAWFAVLAATLLGTAHLRGVEDRAADADGRDRASIARAAVEGDLGRALDVMGRARAVWATPEGADAARAGDLMRGALTPGSAFVGLTWSPRVRAADRAAFEARIGRPLTEAAVSGLRTASPRAEYLPVELVYGRQADDYIGADESSLPMLARVLASARDSGRPRTAAPLPLGPDGEPTARVYLPVFRDGAEPEGVRARRAALAGFIGGSVDVGLLADVAREALQDEGVRLDTAANARPAADEVAAPVASAGATWSVLVPASAPSRVVSTITLAAGLAVLLLVAVVGAVVRRGRRLSESLAARARVEEQLRRQEADTRSVADEHAAFREIATCIAGQAEGDEVYALVARKVGRLLDAHAGAVARFDDDGVARLVGVWSDGDERTGLGEPVDPDGAVAAVQRSGVAERVERSPAAGGGVQVAVPVRLAGEIWGAVAATARDGRSLAGEGAIRLVAFAELLEIEVAGADARARLARQASSDPLTGMANHRVFHERLGEEIARSRRHGRPLALAVIDLDHFKRVNDTYGHQAGDTVLTEVARLLSRHARAEDVLARVGGEEFAWLMPETDDLAAFAAAERARQAIAGVTLPPAGRVTVSAGVSHLAGAADAAELYRQADGALYWAKSHGRDLCCRYSAEVVADTRPGAGTPAEDEPLVALRDAVEAREGAVGHGARVAELAARMAEGLGWEPARIARLRRAAALHDVGKVAVSEDLLGRPTSLTAAERGRVAVHAELGARILAATLDDEQVAWVRAHHERFDGAGVPARLAGEEIPDGARLVALAEAWDAMTTPRPYATTRSRDAAFAEVRRAQGRQFCPHAVWALERAIGPAPALPSRARAARAPRRRP